MTAGPTEPTADQLQYQVEVVVGDLELLYTRGVLIKTPRFPEGSWHIPLFYMSADRALVYLIYYMVISALARVLLLRLTKCCIILSLLPSRGSPTLMHRIRACTPCVTYACGVRVGHFLAYTFFRFVFCVQIALT
ncbi:hypothetical protein JB92DRAFT_831460 [Gautieria morchelliformis]|nr:hypothetical protein JB92DRAFT_831460 [Gautieria morchelliformis]